MSNTLASIRGLSTECVASQTPANLEVVLCGYGGQLYPACIKTIDIVADLSAPREPNDLLQSTLWNLNSLGLTIRPSSPFPPRLPCTIVRP